MSKRKIQITIAVILGVIFVAVLVRTFSRPAKVNVRMTFAGFTTAPSPYASNVKFTNALFSLSNAGTAKVRLTFRDYLIKSGNHTIFMHTDLGVLCSLKSGQSTNLIVPMIHDAGGLGSVGPDYRWKIELSSKRNWLATLERQPKWLQNVVTKTIPQRWMADLYRKDVVSDWITNSAPTPAIPALIKVSPPGNTNSGAP
jgi:hypothetical protein